MEPTAIVKDSRRSILFSRGLVWFFACALTLLDAAFALQLCLPGQRILPPLITRQEFWILSGALFLCSIPGYGLLMSMHRLLGNLLRGKVFLQTNVRLLRRISLCCFAAAAICLVCAPGLPHLLVITLAAGFVGLIVRIVANVFRQAIVMQEELDYTV